MYSAWNRREGDDTTTGRGTVKGHHAQPGDDVTEGGVAPAPADGRGHPKAAASRATEEGNPQGEATSTATQGKHEKEHAAEMGAAKTQSGRGHRKHDE